MTELHKNQVLLLKILEKTIDNPLKLKEARKNVARILTVLREKQIKEENK